MDDKDALDTVATIHSRIADRNEVRLGINKGQVYVLSDTNERTNIIGWGINTAARALSLAEPNQIICTNHFAQPLINEDKALSRAMADLGQHEVKHGETIHIYNYYKKDEFGALAKKHQKRSC